MPLLLRARRHLLPALSLLLTLAAAQSCWYPDGNTLSSDIPCNPNATASACCNAQSYCLVGGGCFTGGVVTRGSCTDKTWNSPECAQFCQTVGTDGETPITPCNTGVSTNSFVCGLNTGSQCDDNGKTFTLASSVSLVLRPAQVNQLVGTAIASSSPSSGSSSSSPSTGAIVGAALGVAVPLLIAIGVLAYLLFREKRRRSSARLLSSRMYRIPDNETKESLTIHPAPSLMHGLGRDSGSLHRPHRTDPHSRSSSRDSYASFRTTPAVPNLSPRPSQILQVPTPARKPVHNSSVSVYSTDSARTSRHVTSLAERIEGMKVTPQLIDVRESNSTSSSLRHELDSLQMSPRLPTERFSPTPREVERYELAASRMSRGG